MAADRHSILIIDKNSGTSFMLASVLSSWNYDVYKVNSFLKAIEYVQNNKMTISLIIVELQEVSESFFEFPRKLSERACKDIPVAVHTTLGDTEFIKRALNCGYGECFIRPVQPELLKKKIDAFIKPDRTKAGAVRAFHLEEDAVFFIKVRIESISEVELSASCENPIRPGTVGTLITDTLKVAGMQPVNLRVDEITKRPEEKSNSKDSYKLKLSFVNLPAEDLIKLKTLVKAKAS